MAENDEIEITKESLWYIDNYVLIRDYYDRTVSRIAARCIRQGNIAVEDYPFYPYIIDVLEELCETGDYILEHQELHPYVEKKIKGGVSALEQNLSLYKQELERNDRDYHELAPCEKLFDAASLLGKCHDVCAFLLICCGSKNPVKLNRIYDLKNKLKKRIAEQRKV